MRNEMKKEYFLRRFFVCARPEMSRSSRTLWRRNSLASSSENASSKTARRLFDAVDTARRFSSVTFY